ncbi:hypothetical protein BH10PSE13_BH10PSE13_13320 [soil metagenome]
MMASGARREQRKPPINFPTDSTPTIAKWTNTNAYMLGGVVEGIDFPTVGVTTSDWQRQTKI